MFWKLKYMQLLYIFVAVYYFTLSKMQSLMLLNIWSVSGKTGTFKSVQAFNLYVAI